MAVSWFTKLCLCLAVIWKVTDMTVSSRKFVLSKKPRRGKDNTVIHYIHDTKTNGNGQIITDLHPDNGEQSISSSQHNNTDITTAKVMICAIMRDEETYIDEWIQYHQLIGIDSMHLFDNSVNGSAKMAYLPQKYGASIRVTHAPGDNYQSRVYNYCLKKYSLTAMWAAFIDIDEFIVLRERKTIQDFLHDIAPTGGAVALSRYTFGSSGELHYKDLPVLTRFTARSATPDKVSKMIAYLPDVLRLEPNTQCSLRAGKYTVRSNGQRIVAGAENKIKMDDVAMVHHYYTKSLEEFRRKRLRNPVSNPLLQSDPSQQAQTAANKDESSADLMDFITSESRANAVQDTFARDFYNNNRPRKDGILERPGK